MSDISVEELNDEDLLILYESTRKLLETSGAAEYSAPDKLKSLKQKLVYIEDELKVRSLWEGD